MAEFSYAKGRLGDSLRFIANEIEEFEKEYLARTLLDYQKDTKIQKLMDRTVENILTALIEVCGTMLAEKGIAVENYVEVLAKAAEILGLNKDEQSDLAKLASQRNRLAHRYLDYKWQAIKMFSEQRGIIKTLLQKVLLAYK